MSLLYLPFDGGGLKCPEVTALLGCTTEANYVVFQPMTLLIGLKWNPMFKTYTFANTTKELRKPAKNPIAKRDKDMV